jgi:isopenicillin N synthase-like dioxygenase
MAITDVPVIDLRPFRTGGAATRRALGCEVDRTCREVGFLTIAGHGVSDALIADAQAAARAFFDLPIEEKLKVRRSAPAFNRGWGAVGEESLAKSLGVGAPADCKESLGIGPVDRPGDGAYFTCAEAFPHFAENRWPARPAELQPVFTAYFRALDQVCRDLMQLFAVALELREDFFADKIDRQCGSLRAINYPAQMATPVDGQLRAGAHTDYGSLTVLKTEDKPGGLQVQRADGEWIDIRPTAETFIVNIGDLMAMWTNDRWRSTLHRVANPPDGAQASRRLSLVFFHQPNYEAEIACLPSCHDADHPPRYQPITSGTHRLMKLNRANDY